MKSFFSMIILSSTLAQAKPIILVEYEEENHELGFIQKELTEKYHIPKSLVEYQKHLGTLKQKHSYTMQLYLNSKGELQLVYRDEENFMKKIGVFYE
jgi:hypothetical protein